MKKRVDGIFTNIISLIKDKHFILALMLLIISYLGTFLSSLYLMNNFGDKLPILNDLFLDVLPYIRIAILYDLLILLSYLFLIISSIKNDIKLIPYFIFMIAFSHIIRSIFIILTPFGNPNGADIGIFNSLSHLFGVYPSGHTINAFLAYKFSRDYYKKINLVLMILLILTLLLGRGHYSLDIFSGLIFGYAIYHFGEHNIKKSMVANVKA
jgi:membrane-associated phospholipid phosphatase